MDSGIGPLNLLSTKDLIFLNNKKKIFINYFKLIQNLLFYIFYNK